MDLLAKVVFALSIALIISACRSDCAEFDQACRVGKLSEQYQQHHDYQSLVSLVPNLNTHHMQRAEVEQLLGKPTYCPTIDSCYYPTDQLIVTMCGEGTEIQGDTCRIPSSGKEVPSLRFPLVLVVRYNLAVSKAHPDASDRLLGFWITPIGE